MYISTCCKIIASIVSDNFRTSARNGWWFCHQQWLLNKCKTAHLRPSYWIVDWRKLDLLRLFMINSKTSFQFNFLKIAFEILTSVSHFQHDSISMESLKWDIK
jgi:hypothetical protein